MSLNPLRYCRAFTAPRGKHMVLLKNMRDADYHVTQQPPAPACLSLSSSLSLYLCLCMSVSVVVQCM